ncbi:hypothetical protein ACQ661_08095 [Pseudidiomarina sp. WS423]|uniref:hypothetical protein n=1 Tax=Pseudidiomarina sp. WS423 TaxID=3425124 RepID=UPI003D6EFE08
MGFATITTTHTVGSAWQRASCLLVAALLVSLLLTLALPAAQAAQATANVAVPTTSQTLVFRAPEPGPLSHALQEIMQEAYAQHNVQVEYVEMPRTRSLVEANNGRIAGELGRLPDLDENYPNLRRSSFPLFGFQLVLVADRRYCGVCNLQDVENLAYINGQQGPVQLLKQESFKGPTVQAQDLHQLHLMFSNNRVRALLINDFEARQLGYYQQKHLVIVPLKYIVGYHYLHKQHEALLAKLDSTLDEMHDNGRITQIFNDHQVIIEPLQEFNQPPHFQLVSAAAGLWRTRTSVDGSGRYWDVIRHVFEPVADELDLHTSSFQRAVLGLQDQRFDMLIGSNIEQVRVDAISSRLHVDYDMDLYVFALNQHSITAAMQGALKRPVCFVAGYHYEHYFPTGTSFYYGSNSLDCFVMLDKGRVGAVVTFRANQPDWITTPYHELKLREADPLHVLFHNTPRGRLLRDWFDTQFRKLVSSGEIRQFYSEPDLEHAQLDTDKDR